MAKALRSTYVAFKRLFGVQLSGEYAWMHIVLMSLLYYIYNHQSQNLKYIKGFEFVIGV